jgi:hypothetical protein
VLQILHLKGNQLTGTIPAAFGYLPDLSWFDLSQNNLLGTIPSSLANVSTLKDFRLSGNMLYDEVPHGLCVNPNINEGTTKLHGCSGVLCPAGTYSESGYASGDKACIPCPEGWSSLYLGSFSCVLLSEADLLAMLYEVLQGSTWPEDKRVNWGNDNYSVCEWAGIDCDTEGNTSSLSFPLTASVDS